MRAVAAVAAAVLCLPGAGSADPPGDPEAAPEVQLDGVLATLEVENDPAPGFVLRSAFVLLLRTELAVRGAPDALHVRVHESVMSAVLEQLVAETVVAREARRAGMDAVDATELAAVRGRIVPRLDGVGGVPALLAAAGAGESEFDALIRRRAVCGTYLLARHPEMLEPSEQDLVAALDSGRFHGAGDAPATRAEVRDALLRDALPGALRQYLRGQGSRVRVRRVRDA